MKNFIKNIKYGILIILFSVSFSCNEDEFLEEVPLDFFSPENSFQSYSNFQSALTDLYARVREIHFGGGSTNQYAHFLGTDIIKGARGGSRDLADYDVFMEPTHGLVRWHWENWYKVISNANTILSRMESSEMTDAQKAEVAAEAKFFRGFAYRYLVYIYGGVPLILDEIIAPKTDFTRASKSEVLDQIILDMKDAADNLPGITEVADGKVSNLVALHYLAETYIAAGEYDNAIAAASTVIDDPATSLMTERFGTRANEDPYDPYLNFNTSGDVYWDLFRRGNQNRGGGNNEALWVAQLEVDIPGGLLSSSGGGGNGLERFAGPVAWLTFQDPDGNEGSIKEPQSNYNSGGRGVSFMMNTDYFLNDLWESDWDNDIRNAPHNIVRDFIYNNPSSAYFGMSSVENPSPTDQAQDWRWYPYPSKITTPQNHPDELFENKDLLTLKSSARSTYRDMYFLRLAETYLLRAEAYLAKNNTALAAADINSVRNRANATPVASGDVTIDYILDERGRELVYEEQRRITLSRTGKLVERIRKYNKLNGDEIKDHYALWPIPFSEIEANKDAEIQQNPGYN